MSSSYGLNNIALAISKLAQILMPLAVYLVARSFSKRLDYFSPMVAKLFPDLSEEELQERGGRIERALETVCGFAAWKVGCDLGYFVVTGQNIWQAFTPAGLIPYTIAQYIV